MHGNCIILTEFTDQYSLIFFWSLLWLSVIRGHEFKVHEYLKKFWNLIKDLMMEKCFSSLSFSFCSSFLLLFCFSFLFMGRNGGTFPFFLLSEVWQINGLLYIKDMSCCKTSISNQKQIPFRLYFSPPRKSNYSLLCCYQCVLGCTTTISNNLFTKQFCGAADSSLTAWPSVLSTGLGLVIELEFDCISQYNAIIMT